MSVEEKPRGKGTPPHPRPSAAKKTDRPVVAHVSTAPPPSPQHQEPARREKVAVIVTHGMGQQVPFETLEGVADALRAAEQRAGGQAPAVHTRFVQLGEKLVPTAALALASPSGVRETHLFEAYWAPLTEGKITTHETVTFLVGAGIRGALHAGRRNRFERLMFNAWYEFGLGRQIWFQFVAAVLTILSLVLINLTLFSVVVPSLLGGLSASWVSGPLLTDLTVDMALLLLILMPCVVLGVAVPALLRRRRSDGFFPAPSKTLTALAWMFVWLALLAVIAAGAIVGTQLARHAIGVNQLQWPQSLRVGLLGQREPSIAPLAVLWGVVFGLSYLVRRFILQYVGDVAIYVSTNSVNRFSTTREEIQKVTYDLMRAVYAHRTDGAFTYQKVVVVGHSLGSVVAYDELNRLLMDDAFAGVHLEAAKRTALLLTFGSPLDKVAYIFRSQRPAQCSIRESLAEARQPMLTAYSCRPVRWVNIYSPNDWIGASLDFFDDERPPAGQELCNLIDPEATTPLMAHSEHWSGYLFAEVLRLGAIDDLPGSVELRQLWRKRSKHAS
jgi:hypothetical protein